MGVVELSKGRGSVAKVVQAAGHGQCTTSSQGRTAGTAHRINDVEPAARIVRERSYGNDVAKGRESYVVVGEGTGKGFAR